MKIMSNREYWIWTEVFVYIHHGKDYCPHQQGACVHCEWIAKVFDRLVPIPAPKPRRMRTRRKYAHHKRQNP